VRRQAARRAYRSLDARDPPAGRSGGLGLARSAALLMATTGDADVSARHTPIAANQCWKSSVTRGITSVAAMAGKSAARPHHSLITIVTRPYLRQ
jgi:hypothetical protein